jgi:hypothetical protein
MNILHIRFVVPIFSILFAFTSVSLFAWQTVNGVAICIASNYQDLPVIASDGAGGAIISWEDYRSVSEGHIYAQHINNQGSTLWTTNGVEICNNAEQNTPQIVSDGEGGAIITWNDGRTIYYNIYAQRINSQGSTLWTTNGVPICTDTVQYQQFPIIVSDSSNGAVIAWEQNIGEFSFGIYVQRVNSQGSTLWTNNGISVSTVIGIAYGPEMVNDGSGGAYITWADARNTTSNPSENLDIFAQHINSQGSTLWALNGMAICTAQNFQSYPLIVDDGTGGAIITWDDARVSSTLNIYGQRVNSQGSTLWTANGLKLFHIPVGMQNSAASDGFGGMVITWQSANYGSGSSNIYAQRIDGNGSLLWSTTGVSVCTATGDQTVPMIINDGAGGAIITWEDDRYDGVTTHIFSQRVNSQGSTLWTLNGVAICTAINYQYDPMIVTNDDNGAIITWWDARDDGNSHIYAQSVNDIGLVPIIDWFDYDNPKDKSLGYYH